MIKLSVVLFTATATLFACSLSAQADVYSVVFNGSAFSLNATVTTDPTNTFATTITGTVTSVSIGTVPITALEAGSPTALGLQGNDNVLSAVGQLVTNNGLAFDTANGNQPSYPSFVYDLYSTGTGPFSYYLYADNSNPDAANLEIGDQGTLVVTDLGATPVAMVPEPSTWLMMILGFLGIGYAGCRRARATGFADGIDR